MKTRTTEKKQTPREAEVKDERTTNITVERSRARSLKKMLIWRNKVSDARPAISEKAAKCARDSLKQDSSSMRSETGTSDVMSTYIVVLKLRAIWNGDVTGLQGCCLRSMKSGRIAWRIVTAKKTNTRVLRVHCKRRSLCLQRNNKHLARFETASTNIIKDE